MRGLDDVLQKINPERVASLLERAVHKYSPSYKESAAVHVFTDALEEAGVPYRLQHVPIDDEEEAGDADRANVIIEVGPSPPALLWIGHVDTIPLHHGEELTVRREGDVLFGLGAADMKGGCVAAVEAVTALVEAGVELQRGLAVALVVGEEEYGDGSRALEEELAAPLMVIGEPTGLVPCTDHFGYLELRLDAEGRRAHAALPEVGQNAIHAMLRWLLLLTEELRRPPFGEAVALNLREISGGTGLFIVPDACEAVLDIHLPPDTGPEHVLARVEEVRDRVAAEEGVRLSYERLHWSMGYAQPREDPLLAPLLRAFSSVGLDFAPSAFRSHSDGNLLYRRGVKPVICGPGELELAHRREERVSLAEVQRAARLYAALFLEACGG